MFFLKNGITIPETGFGTWQIEYGDICVKAVKEALKTGYRLIDTARAYGNEKSVGIAVKEALAEGIIKDRSEVFVTSKLWNTDRSYNKVFKAFEKTMRNLELDYIDLYLIHWPANRKRYKDPERVNAEVWRAFEELYEAGKIRAIGVSNFYPRHLEALKKTAKIMPMVNQVELHIGYMDRDAIAYNEKENILTQAYSPLGTGELLKNKSLKEISEKYGVSVSTLCISYLKNEGIIPIIKTLNPYRMMENFEAEAINFKFEDKSFLDNLPFIGGHAHNPDEVEF